MSEPVEIIAHRGAGQDFVRPDGPPENTIQAVEQAWIDGADAAEVDVRLTADGHVIAIHDSTTPRTTNRDLRVGEHTLAELQGLDAGGWKGERWCGARLPTLADLIACVPSGRRLYVEVKSGPATVEPLLRVFRASGRPAEQLPIISFNCDTLRVAQELLPAHPRHQLLSFSFDSNARQWNAGYAVGRVDSSESRSVWSKPAAIAELVALAKGAAVAGVGVSAAQPDDLFAQLREAGIRWAVWTVDDINTAVAMAVKGARAITTNRPQHLRHGLAIHGFNVGRES